MNKKIFWIYALVSISMLLITNMAAYGAKKQQKQFSEQSFDIKLEKLPPNYNGHDIIRVADVLKKRLAKHSKKDEFETTEQFKKKFEKELSKPIIGSMNIDSLYAFTGSIGAMLEASFDADSEIMQVYVDFSTDDSVNKNPFHHALSGIKRAQKMSADERAMREEIAKDEKHRARTREWDDRGREKIKGWDDRLIAELAGNALLSEGAEYFGISVLLEPEVKKKFLSNRSGIDMRLPVPLKIKREVAKEIKDNLYVLFVGGLQKPYVTQRVVRDGSLGKASVFSLVHLNLYEIWLFDIQSGTILYRLQGLQEYDPKKLNAIIKLQPNDAEAYRNRGVAYFRLGNDQCAIEDFNEAIRLKPDYAEAYYLRARAYRFLNNTQRAIEDFNEAIRLKPDYAEAHEMRGKMYLKQGNKNLGCSDVKKACDLGECKGLVVAKHKGECH